MIKEYKAESYDVAVIGGGNSALQEAILLSETSKKVYVVQNLDFLTGEVTLQEQLKAKSNVEIILGSVLDAYLGENELTGIRVLNQSNNTTSEIALNGVFLAIGLMPQNEPFANIVNLDARGYVEANENCTLENGIFVAGDCRQKEIRQVTTAAADGAVSALAACRYVDALK